MLSRWFGRRTPLDPARLFVLTAEPGHGLPRSITVVHQELGELELPEGRVVACDPHDPGVPLARLPPGRHPAQLRVADLGGRDQRTAAVLLRAGDDPPVHWEPAGPELRVDSATGCLAGPRALAALRAPGALLLDGLVEALAETERPTVVLGELASRGGRQGDRVLDRVRRRRLPGVLGAGPGTAVPLACS